MGWFDEQIKCRKQNDNDVFADSFINIASAVMGKRIFDALNDDCTVTKNAIDEILKYYHVKTREIPDSIRDMNEQLEYLMRPYGIMRRKVFLSNGWYKDAIGAMLGQMKEDGHIVALIPSGSGYSYTDFRTGKKVRINQKNQSLFASEGIAFYKPFPLEEIGIPQLLKYMLDTLRPSDFAAVAVSSLFVSLFGMFVPKLNNILFSTVIDSGSMRLLAAILFFLICVSVSTLLLSSVNYLTIQRINTKMNISVQAAAMMRVLSLPASFFKKYSAGELSSRVEYINSLCSILVTAILSTGFTSLFSLVYISQIFI